MQRLKLEIEGLHDHLEIIKPENDSFGGANQSRVKIGQEIDSSTKLVPQDCKFSGADDNSKNEYFGIYVDGGMLNNLPLHAFNNLVGLPVKFKGGYELKLTYRGVNTSTKVAGLPEFASRVNSSILALRLEQKADLKQLNEESIFPAESIVISSWIQSLLGTLMYPAEEGQIRTLEERSRTVSLNASYDVEQNLQRFDLDGLSKKVPNFNITQKYYTIGVADFASPSLERERDRKVVATIKEHLQKVAGQDLEHFLDQNE